MTRQPAHKLLRVVDCQFFSMSACQFLTCCFQPLLSILLCYDCLRHVSFSAFQPFSLSVCALNHQLQNYQPPPPRVQSSLAMVPEPKLWVAPFSLIRFQPFSLSACQRVSVSACQRVSMSACQHVSVSAFQFVYSTINHSQRSGLARNEAKTQSMGCPLFAFSLSACQPFSF